MNQVQRLAILTGLASLMIALPAQAETETEKWELRDTESSSAPDSLHSNVPQLMDFEQAATTVDEWISQIDQQEVESIAQALIQITGIRLNATDAGLEVSLDATDELQPPQTSIMENVLIADIPNAVLALPEGDRFEQFAPAEGITLVSATNLNDGGVRVSITGTEAPPQAEVSIAVDILVLSVEPRVATVADADADADAIQVVVTATRTEEDILDVPRSVTVIDRELLEQQTAITRNLGDILGTLVPGFGPPSRSDRTNFQSLRGRQPAVLIDGVPQRNNSSFNVQLSYIDPASIERIEVVRGPSATYGSEATGGVINIITRSPVDEDISATSTVGTFGSLGELEDTGFGYELGQTFAFREGNFDFTSSFFLSSTGDFFDAEGDRIPFNNAALSNTDVLNVLGKVGYDITDAQRLQFTVNHTRRNRQFPGIDFVEADDPEIRSTSLDLSYTNENLLGSDLQLQGYYRESAQIPSPFDGRDVFFNSIYQLTSSEDSWGGRLQVDTPLASSLDLLWGADYENQTNNAFLVEDLDIEAFLDDGDARRIGERVYFPPYDLESLGLFAQLQWQANERLQLSGGVRYERISFEADDFTTLFGDAIEGGKQNANDTVFNTGVVVDVTDEISLFGSFTQGFAVPRLSSTLGFLTAGSSVDSSLEDLEPQKVNEFELGVRGNWDTVQFSLAGFYNTSELGTFFVESADRVFDVVRAPERNYGIEATFDWQPVERWQLGGLVSWVEGEVDFEDDGDFVAQASSIIQPFNIAAYVQNQTTPDWSNRLQVLIVGDRSCGFDAGLDPQSIEGYIVLNLISNLRLGPGTLQLGIENLLDNQYRSVADQARFSPVGPEPGRIVRITYSFDW